MDSKIKNQKSKIKNKIPWYRWNYFIPAAMFFGGLALLIYLADNGLIKFILSFQGDYGNVLLRLLVIAGILIGLGWRLAVKRRSPLWCRVSPVLLLIFLASIFRVYQHENMAYDREDLSFTHQDTRLSGTLYLPHGEGPHPAIVYVHGSPDWTRSVYHVWADFFVRQGVAAFVYDKRGTGESEGVFVSNNNTSYENLTLLAGDVEAAVDLLHAHPAIASDRIGLSGISQAGWIIPIVASDSSKVAFTVTLSGGPVTVGEERLYSDLMGDHIDDPLVSIAEAEKQVLQAGPSEFDPMPYLLQINKPGLWLIGDQDLSLPPQASVRNLKRLQEEHQKPFDYVVLTGADHLLSDHNAAPPDFDPRLWSEIAAWLKKQRIISP